VRAVAKALLTVWLTTTLTFFLIRLMPGSPVELKIDELIQQSGGGLSYADAAALASGLFNIDLNAPLHEQYFTFIANVARGDLGNSFLSAGTPVMSIIVSVLPWTLFAVGTGLLLSFACGVFLGLFAAYRRNSLFDRIVSTGGSLVSSIPNYLTALLIVLFLGIQLRIVPITRMRGAFTPGIEPGFTPEFIGDIFFHAALPITVFFLKEDYVTAARARGLPDGRITSAYVGRNAALPLVAEFAISVGFIVGGAAVIEQIFVYQGIGLRLLKAVDSRDYPLMQGILLMLTISVVVANLLADLLYTKLDPRIGRAGGSAG
jgi:peptide/nickel transport system permease protein